MKVEVQQVAERGRSVSAGARALRPSYRGMLRMQEARNHALGRTVVTAELFSLTDGPVSVLIPTLHDVCVLYLVNGRMRVRGFELVEGGKLDGDALGLLQVIGYAGTFFCQPFPR